MIRRDIYSLKLWDNALGDWVHSRMGYTLEAVLAYAEGRYKIVHPSHWVVDAYVAAGNEILG